MDKNTLSHYGWVVICIIVIAILLGLATPFGNYVKDSVLETAHSFGATVVNSLNKSGAGGSDNENGSTGGNNSPTINGQLDHTVTFMVDGKPYEIMSVKNGNPINAPIVSPTSPNGKFSGWYIDDAEVQFPYTPMEDINIEAVFLGLVERIYDHFDVDETEYPYVVIYYDNTYLHLYVCAKWDNSNGLTVSEKVKYAKITASGIDGTDKNAVVEKTVAASKTNLQTTGFKTLPNDASYYYYGNFNFTMKGTVHRI